MIYLYLPFFLLAIVMGIYERLDHKRGMGKWERYGHPLDTLTVLIPFSYINSNYYSSEHLYIYLFLCSFSCLFVTKDEFIHHELCSKFEHWLHALLFILHPLVFLSAALMWKEGGYPFLSSLPYLVGGFMFYQIIIWSIPWKKRTR